MLWCCDVVMLKDRTARRQTVSLSVVGAELIFWSHWPVAESRWQRLAISGFGPSKAERHSPSLRQKIKSVSADKKKILSDSMLRKILRPNNKENFVGLAKKPQPENAL